MLIEFKFRERLGRLSQSPRFESKARALWPHELRHERRAQSEGGAKVSLQVRRAAARGHCYGPLWHAVCGEVSLRFESKALALWPHELSHERRAQSEGGAKVSLQVRRAAARGHCHGPWWHAV